MNESKDVISRLITRLEKIGITIELIGNYPWIYLHKVNGNRVLERYQAEHGYTIAFTPIKPKQELKLLNIKYLFEIIRKYK